MVREACGAVARHLRPGTLVVLESTTYPGTTDELVRPILEQSGLTAGQDFWLAFSPERVDPGNRAFGIRNTPKVVGGHSPACASAAAAFYGKFVERVVQAAGTREAEMAKLIENTYRHVNIALVNEMAVFSHELGIDLWDAISCAATKPFGFQAFRPGPGWADNASRSTPTTSPTRSARSATPSAWSNWPRRSTRGCRATSSNAPNTSWTVPAGHSTEPGAAAGVTYKADIADHRETPARDVVRRLRPRRARLLPRPPRAPVDRGRVPGPGRRP